MGLRRGCSKTACRRIAVATLTYVYADRAVVVGPLATYAEPHTYDLCLEHAERMTAPRGWEVVRLDGDYTEPEPGGDDLLALAEAVREAGRPLARRHPGVQAGLPPTGAAAEVRAEAGVVETARRGHLRVLRDG
ncbi:MAG: DUF3499 domain-containing protein [Intrasporangium sp.]|uniref:DUF3499 domain-containing protein n=1 Tax=Intrasporangium sp. TaxID=1925024 RepID=UPI00264734C2|nr:DUF3499 domain-containing protein [Intrasporangium sp.]MDN5797187.1 DUF3499 domain-containing protein [Intrasporangium sp.]